MKNGNIRRRSFFVMLGASLLPVFNGFGVLGSKLLEAAEDLKSKLVNPGDAMPKALQYSPAALTRPKNRSSESCANCLQYTSKGKVGNDEVGACLLFSALPKGLVPAKGWCSGWAKKA